MKNIGFILMMGLCLLCACQDKDDFGTPDTADGKTEILLQQMDVPVVVTRAYAGGTECGTDEQSGSRECML